MSTAHRSIVARSPEGETQTSSPIEIGGLTLRDETGSEIIGFGMKLPALELDYPLQHSIWCKERIKGGNWLTVLSTELLDKAGGVEQLAATLGEPFVFTDYSGGSLIRAGSAPEVGDRNREIDTPAYARLARALKPIRIQIHGPVHGISRDEFEAWLARFDE